MIAFYHPRSRTMVERSIAKRPQRRLMRMSIGFVLAAALGGVVDGGATFTAAAQDGGWSRDAAAMPPMPPARPAGLSTPPQLPTPPVNGPPPGVDPMVADFAADMPQVLPAASRAQMHRCGREWQKMKASGATADKTWFAFARVCLVQGK